MEQNLLFISRITDREENRFECKICATEYNYVEMSVSKNGAPVYRDVQLVDAYGRKTRVPATVLIALQTPCPSSDQLRKIAVFNRLCLRRLTWSLGCLSV